MDRITATVSEAWDVLGIGNSAVDELIFIERFPQPEAKVRVLRSDRQGGGLAATALVAAARQGARAAFCSRFGWDELSLFTLQDLAREQVDCSPSHRAEEGHPYHAYVLVDQQDHTRTIFYEVGDVEPPLELITPELVARCKVLLIDHHAPSAAIQAAGFARAAGIPVVADIESEKVPNFQLLLDSADHLILSLAFAQRITGKQEAEDVICSLSAPWRAVCVLTAGSRGGWYAQRGREVTHFPAYPVAVVDTTGCGDVFHGAYAAALARGESIPQSVAIASASAAMKATQPGGRAGIPDLMAVRQFLKGRHAA